MRRGYFKNQTSKTITRLDTPDTGMRLMNSRTVSVTMSYWDEHVHVGGGKNRKELKPAARFSLSRVGWKPRSLGYILLTSVGILKASSSPQISPDIPQLLLHWPWKNHVLLLIPLSTSWLPQNQDDFFLPLEQLPFRVAPAHYRSMIQEGKKSQFYIILQWYFANFPLLYL